MMKFLVGFLICGCLGLKISQSILEFSSNGVSGILNLHSLKIEAFCTVQMNFRFCILSILLSILDKTQWAKH